MTWPAPVRVVGVGSSRGDDAVGWEVVRRLREQPDLAGHIELFVVNGGHRILDHLDPRGTLVLVDGMETGDEPGAIHSLCWPHPGLQALRPGSTHDVHPAAALCLAMTLGIAPSMIVVFGIEIERAGAQPSLSPSVTAAVGKLVPRLAEELKSAR